MKHCTQCEAKKALPRFGKDKRAKDGRSSECRECKNARERKRYAKNPAKTNARQKKWRENNREKDAARTRRWRENNREREAARLRRWGRENPEKYRDKNRRSRRTRRARRMSAEGSFTQAEFRALLDHFGWLCLCCGRRFGDSLPPTADHVVPLSKGGSNWIGNIQPLCGRCNDSKGTKTADYRGAGF